MASSDKDKIASSDEELEENLQKAGNRLLDELPSSVDELLDLLDQVENCLSRVEQSPPELTRKALSSSQKALVAIELMNHSNEDVKVSVASCISEITRITAPDAPYDDDQMKVVFQLIVSSFEKLDDKSNRSYDKRTSILETVAKVRSCVVMLDLECDALIIEMLQYLLTTIRDYHPPNVVLSMETIMTLVLEESEDISLELLSPILSCVKKHNEEIVPIARRLAEKVLEKCATKIRPVLVQSVKSMDISLNDFSIVVAHICQEAASVDEKNDADVSAEHSVPVAMEGASHGELDPTKDGPTRPVMNNGKSPIKYDNCVEDSNSLKNPEHSDGIKQSKSDDVQSKAEHDSIVAEKIVESKVQPKKKSKRRGKKRKPAKKVTQSLSVTKTEPSLVTETELPPVTETQPTPVTETAPTPVTKTAPTPVTETAPTPVTETAPTPVTETEPTLVTEIAPTPVTGAGPSGSTPNIDEKESESLPVSVKSQSKEVCSSSREVTSAEAVEPIDNKTVTDTEMSSPKTLENDIANVVSSSPIRSQGDEINSPKDGNLKEGSIQKAAVSAETVTKKLSESTLSSEFKTKKRSGEKACDVMPEEDTIPAQEDTSKEDSETASDPEVKSLREAGRIVDSSDEDEQDSSKKQKIEEKTGRGKASVGGKKSKASTKDADKESVSVSKSAKKSAEGEDHLEETPKTSTKRKRTPGKEIASNKVEVGKNLVGKKIKVFWPEDEKFYEGIVDSWDSRHKKHTVLYTDGDEEVLYLRSQRWELVEGDSVSDREQGTPPCLDDSTEIQPTKKAKSNSNSSKRKTNASSSTRGGAGFSTKSKGFTAKSGSKSNSESKQEGKSKDVTPKVSKSVDSSKASGKSKNVESETPKNSKKLDHGTPKTATKKLEQGTLKTATKKLEQDIPKTATKVKGKTPNSSTKPSSNGTGKLKSGSSSKVEEDVEVENSLEEPLKAMRKNPDSSSKVKTGKKRRRGGR